MKVLWFICWHSRTLFFQIRWNYIFSSHVFLTVNKDLKNGNQFNYSFSSFDLFKPLFSNQYSNKRNYFFYGWRIINCNNKNNNNQKTMIKIAIGFMLLKSRDPNWKCFMLGKSFFIIIIIIIILLLHTALIIVRFQKWFSHGKIMIIIIKIREHLFKKEREWLVSVCECVCVDTI